MKYTETILSSDYIELLEHKLYLIKSDQLEASQQDVEFIISKIQSIKELETLKDVGFDNINHNSLFN